MWALRGLRNGLLTTRWPARADEHATATRGPATVLSSPAGAEAGWESVCPTGAIDRSPADTVRLDQGRCILCGRCVAERPDVFAWQAGPGSAVVARPALIVPPAAETAELVAATRHGLHASTMVATIHVYPPRAISDQPPTGTTMQEAEGPGCSACSVLPRVRR